LAHPLRLRILFACREHARTNKELAQLLDTTPGTIHYHLKPLVEEGFLRPEEPRPGPRGSTEQPYRSTGKSWELGGTQESGRALRQVGAQEVLAAREQDEIGLSRLGLSLPPDEVDELNARIHEVIEEFARRSRSQPDADERDLEGTDSVTLFYALYRSPDADTTT
jgi:predicted ArsR family transcriptional regulator